MKKHLLLLLAIGLTGCGKDYRPTDAAPTELAPSDAIIGGQDWTPLTEIKKSSTVYENGSKVGQITFDKPDGDYVCTAFNIGKNQIMTNNHCISSATSSKKVTYEIGSDTFDCSEFVLTSKSLDYTVLKCKGDLDSKYGTVGLSNKSISFLAQSVYVVHFNCNYIANPNCTQEVLVSPGAAWKTILGSIEHNADTLGGSSGGAVFDFTTHRVVALHNVGVGDQANGLYNKANEMKKIVADIYKRKPSILW